MIAPIRITFIATSFFMKNKDRRNSFSSIGQPPKPVLTRWNTRLSSAMWHSDKLPFIQNFINQMEGNGLVLQRARLHVNDSDLPQQLVKLNLSWNVANSHKSIEGSAKGVGSSRKLGGI